MRSKSVLFSLILLLILALITVPAPESEHEATPYLKSPEAIDNIVPDVRELPGKKPLFAELAPGIADSGESIYAISKYQGLKALKTELVMRADGSIPARVEMVPVEVIETGGS